MREEKNENSKRTKSMISYGGKWNEKQGLVFWFSGASLARVAAGLIGTSDVFFCLCYAKANLEKSQVADTTSGTGASDTRRTGVVHCTSVAS